MQFRWKASSIRKNITKQQVKRPGTVSYTVQWDFKIEN
jgi:hypothetical protein